MKKKSRLWFKRRRYGWGWTPTTWQGWAVTILYITSILIGTGFLDDNHKSTFTTEDGFYLAFVATATVALFYISIKHGPRPRWRWGSKLNDNPDEDY